MYHYISNGFRLAFAAWLSFVLAVYLGIDNAYWASMPVWVIAQNSRGMMYQRGFYRIVGTLVGAIVGLAVLRLSHNPYILMCGLSVTLFAALFLMKTSHGTKGYLPQMTAVTMVIIIVPALLFKPHIEALALSRVECTFIGVIVVTILTARSTPQLHGTRWNKDLLRWIKGTDPQAEGQAEGQVTYSALRFAAFSSLSILCCAMIFYSSGWPAGELTTLGVCIFTMALAGLQNPYDMTLKMLVGVICGVLMALFYRTCVQPFLTSDLMTVLSIIPFFCIGGLLRVWKKTAIPALDGNMCFLLAGQAGMPAVTLNNVLNECSALVIAVALVCFFYRKTMRPEKSMK